MGQSASKKQNARHSQRVSRTSVWFGVAGAAIAACRATSSGILVLLATASVQPCMAATAGDDQRSVAAAFGSGVHAYYASDYARSYDDLTGAIEAGSLDPRTFYFRGLAALKLGRSDEAAADFEDGANREADGGGKRFDISNAGASAGKRSPAVRTVSGSGSRGHTESQSRVDPASVFRDLRCRVRRTEATQAGIDSQWSRASCQASPEVARSIGTQR